MRASEDPVPCLPRHQQPRRAFSRKPQVPGRQRRVLYSAPFARSTSSIAGVCICKPTMAATGRTLSPGGALLRASRLFSIPSALPTPPGDHQGASSSFSDTATKTYPILQTVTVPDVFRQRGDWGFKRNFPLRTTVEESPFLQIKQVDAMEQVTDFATADPHTLNLKRMDEMNVAISTPHATSGLNESMYGPRFQSVFEDHFDFTALNPERILAAGQNRWKYRGPWLANLTHGEFQQFLKKQVRGRRAEFRKVICEHLAQKQTQAAQQRAMDEATGDAVREVRPDEITDEHVTEFFRVARRHHDELYGLISKFLDLAPIEHNEFDVIGSMAPNQSKEVNPQDPYAQYGPPVTHPSAGLSYLRTTAFLENHPVYGPQKSHPPVKARVLGISERVPAKAAVGGFVANSFGNLNKLVGMEYLARGGTKEWVQVTSAQIDSKGRPILMVKQAGGTEKLIQREMVGETRVFRDQVDQPMTEDIPINSLRSSIRTKTRPTVRMSGPGSYGA